MPFAPTAVPVLASVKETPSRSFVVPLVCEFQFTPPLVVRRIIPPSPTAVPVLASVKKTLLRLFVVPLYCKFQFTPPLVVRRIVPVYPTAVPVLALVKETALRSFPCGSGFCQTHWAFKVLKLINHTKIIVVNRVENCKTVFIFVFYFRFLNFFKELNF